MNLKLLKTITVLYVEDESTLQDEICENIQPFVKQIIKASNGLEGLQKFKENKLKIDLVISDILMPELNGIDMVDSIRKIDLDIPVIYTTAFNDIKYINKGYVFKVDSEGMTIMDMTMLYETAERAVIKLSGWPLGLVERISRKDMRVFLGLMSFLD